MRQALKVLLVVSVLCALAACHLPNTIPTLMPTLAKPLPPTSTTLPQALPTAAPTSSPTSPFGGWPVYTNQKYGFSVRYPPAGQVTNPTDVSARIQLPVAPGTNLSEKFLDVSVAENVMPCSSPNARQYAPGTIQAQPVTVNNQAFTLENGSDAGAGNIYDWTAYSIAQGTACVSLTFVLHSSNIQNYATPPAEFDPLAEAAVFASMVSTFHWSTP